MTKKQGVRAVVFLVVLLGFLWKADALYRFKPTVENLAIQKRFNEMYLANDNTWDGVFLGASNVDRAWAAPLAWKNYGMTVYPMSSDGCPFILQSSILKEVLKRQKLSFAVVDLHGVEISNMETNTIKLRRVIDNMKRSCNWYDAIQKGCAYLEEFFPEQIGGSIGMLKASYYMPLIQFHTRLVSEGICIDDFLDPGRAPMKGVYTARQHKKTNRVELIADEEVPELTELQKYLLDDMITCAKEEQIALLFVKLPTGLKPEKEESMNAAAAYVEAQGYPVLNFNDAEVLAQSDMNGEEDFFDSQHLNTKGSAKFTAYMASWILEQVPQLTDHRGDTAYADWEEASAEYDAYYEESLKQIKKWLKKHPLDEE